MVPEGVVEVGKLQDPVERQPQGHVGDLERDGRRALRLGGSRVDDDVDLRERLEEPDRLGQRGLGELEADLPLELALDLLRPLRLLGLVDDAGLLDAPEDLLPVLGVAYALAVGDRGLLNMQEGALPLVLALDVKLFLAPGVPLLAGLRAQGLRLAAGGILLDYVRADLFTLGELALLEVDLRHGEELLELLTEDLRLLPAAIHGEPLGLAAPLDAQVLLPRGQFPLGQLQQNLRFLVRLGEVHLVGHPLDDLGDALEPLDGLLEVADLPREPDLALGLKVGLPGAAHELLALVERLAQVHQALLDLHALLAGELLDAVPDPVGPYLEECPDLPREVPGLRMVGVVLDGLLDKLERLDVGLGLELLPGRLVEPVGHRLAIPRGDGLVVPGAPTRPGVALTDELVDCLPGLLGSRLAGPAYAGRNEHPDGERRRPPESPASVDHGLPTPSVDRDLVPAVLAPRTIYTIKTDLSDPY